MGLFNKKTVSDRRGKKLGVRGTNKNGVVQTVLNPYGKSAKYASELHTGNAITDGFKRKRDDNGKLVKLSNTQLAWRGGYLQARSDNAAAFKARKAKARKK